MFTFLDWHVQPIITDNVWQNSALASKSDILLSRSCLVHSLLSNSKLLHSLLSNLSQLESDLDCAKC